MTPRIPNRPSRQPATTNGDVGYDPATDTIPLGDGQRHSAGDVLAKAKRVELVREARQWVVTVIDAKQARKLSDDAVVALYLSHRRAEGRIAALREAERFDVPVRWPNTNPYAKPW